MKKLLSIFLSILFLASVPLGAAAQSQTGDRELIRVKGKTRYETSFAIADETKAKMGVDKFDNIIIASGTGFADALAGSYLAKVKAAPILMASGKNDNINNLKLYIQANLAENGTVYILGGTAAVNQQTEDVLNDISGITVKRLKGKTRYETNIEILKEAEVYDEDILVATGITFADSLSASAAGKPILLVDGKKSLSAIQKIYLDSLSTNNLYIIGGTGAVGENYESELSAYGNIERVKGKSRYETSVAIAEKFFANPDYAVIAYAENFPDGLCGGPLAMTTNAPLILTKTDKQTAAKAYMQTKGISSGAVLGGASLINDKTAKDIFGVDKITPESKCPDCGSEEHTVHPKPQPPPTPDNPPLTKTPSVILVCSNLGDKSFNDSADAGLKRLKNKGLIDYKVYEYGWDNSKVPGILTNVASGYDIVVCSNLGYGMAAAWMRNNAASYPDTMFILYDEPVDLVDVPNVQTLAYKTNEADFMAGALAALVSETGVIGFVGGMESPVVRDYLVGYIQGAKYVNPDIKVDVTYIGSYTDAAKGKDLGVFAINKGADVLHAVAGTAGNGYIEAAREAGKLAISVDMDRYEVFKYDHPNLAKAIVTSSLKDIGKSLETVIQSRIDGSYRWSQCMWFGAAEGCVGIVENENYLKLVSADDQAALAKIKSRLANGEITVSTAYGMDSATLNALINSVK